MKNIELKIFIKGSFIQKSIIVEQKHGKTIGQKSLKININTRLNNSI